MRLSRFAATLAVAFLLFPLVAQATPRWHIREVGWRQTYIVGTTPATKDTAFAHVGPVGLADTSQWVLLDRLATPSAVATGDSLPVAFWVFQSDTSAAYTASLTALTVATDIGGLTSSNSTTEAIRAQNVAGTNFAPGSCLVTTGVKIVVSPIKLGHIDPITARTINYATQFMPIRCRVTAGVGAQGLAQSRVYIAYIRDEP